MDIAEISTAMSQANILNAVNTAVLDMSLDMAETTSDNLTKMMELSVNPNIGSNIDVSI